MNLVGNQLRTLDKEVMEPLVSLEILLLDSNQLEDINGNLSIVDVRLIIGCTWFGLH